MILLPLNVDMVYVMTEAILCSSTKAIHWFIRNVPHIDGTITLGLIVQVNFLSSLVAKDAYDTVVNAVKINGMI